MTKSEEVKKYSVLLGENRNEYGYCKVTKEGIQIGTTDNTKRAKSIIDEHIKNTTFKCRRYTLSGRKFYEYRGYKILDLAEDNGSGHRRFYVSELEKRNSTLREAKKRIDKHKE